MQIVCALVSGGTRCQRTDAGKTKLAVRVQKCTFGRCVQLGKLRLVSDVACLQNTAGFADAVFLAALCQRGLYTRLPCAEFVRTLGLVVRVIGITAIAGMDGISDRFAGRRNDRQRVCVHMRLTAAQHTEQKDNAQKERDCLFHSGFSRFLTVRTSQTMIKITKPKPAAALM